MWKENKKGNVTLYFVFMIMAIIVLVVAGTLAPLGVRLNTEMLVAGQRVINSSVNRAGDISDATVRAEVEGILTESRDAMQNNIEINAGLFRYAWLIIIVLVGVVIFLFTRSIIEQRQSGFV
jgi:heme/copper-type cytochrome/quinol oxidase subunit 2